MPNRDKTGTGVEAFIDRGFLDSKTFCTQFLYSSEFSTSTLKTLVKQGKTKPKYDLAVKLAASLESQTLDPEKVLRAFVQQPRKWLSFKLGHCTEYPVFETANNLLTNFGQEGWYGPIKDQDSSRQWYIRTCKVPFYEQVYQAEGVSKGEIAEQVNSVATYQIRWTVLAEIGTNYVALSWNGFRFNELKGGLYDPQIESLMQFPYWHYIPSFFDELTEKCKANWQHPVLHKLVLQDLWDKYLSNPQYIWRHLRIRADNRGVALNAHSTGAFDQEKLQMRGLQALSRQLAYSALNFLNIQESVEIITSIENSLLRTLIQEWGTKSYEFSLNGISTTDNQQKSVFRAHCYFANGSSPSPQDTFQHLHCFTGNYGGSVQTLNFLLSELGY